MPILQVYLVEGRSEDQKSAFIASVTEAAVSTLGVPAETVRVVIMETPAANWGKGGTSIKHLAARREDPEPGS